jgi:hypothetical protein
MAHREDTAIINASLQQALIAAQEVRGRWVTAQEHDIYKTACHTAGIYTCEFRILSGEKP